MLAPKRNRPPILPLRYRFRILEPYGHGPKGLIMRVALCVVAVLLGFASFGYAQSSTDKINPRWKRIEIPTINPNVTFSGRATADQSNIWQNSDPVSLGQSRHSSSNDNATMTFSTPLQW